MNKRVLPTNEPGDDDRAPEKKAEPALNPIAPAISKQVFALYEGGKMSKRDAHEARVLAALWQIVFNTQTMHAQSVINATALIEAIQNPKCPECGS